MTAHPVHTPKVSGGELRPFLALLRQAAPRKTALALALILLVSLTEWVGLLLLVPLLALTGLDVGSGAVGQIAEGARAVFAAVGLRTTVLAVLAVYVAVVIARALLQRWQTLAAVDLERTILVHLRKRLYHALVHARWLFLSRARSSDLLHALNTQCLSVSYASNTLVSLVASVLVAAVYVGLAFHLSPVMTLLVLASGVVLLALLRHGSRRARESGAQMNQRSSELLGAMSEHLSGIKTVKSFSAEERNAAIYAQLNDAVAHTYRRTQRNYATIRVWFDIGAVLILATLLFVSIQVVALSTAEILLLLFLFGRLVPRFSGLQQGYQVLVHAMPSFAAVMDRLRDAEAQTELAAVQLEGALALHQSIALEDVSFDYQAGREQQAVADLELSIPANRTTAIVGPSGAGKSTIADLVMGLLTPDRGTVHIDDVPLTTDRLRAWRQQIGYVAQDTFLFHSSIRENLLWSRPEAEEHELWTALRMAAADRFVATLPDGLDTVIGDRGVLISGGERQRIALARALLRKPTLLILDEATSALDSENEWRILRAIDELHGTVTILVITHRLSTVRGADVIHVVEHGRHVETGTWGSLLTRGGRFSELCRAQGLDHQFRGPAAAPAGGKVAVS